MNLSDQDKKNLLHLASFNGQTEIVKLLIENGIDINQTNEDGRNALHLACANGNIHVVELLVEK